jgi:hypothetical protein
MENTLLATPSEEYCSDSEEIQEVPVGTPVLSALDRRRSIGATEAALLIGVSMRTLRRYAEAGLIPGAYRVGRAATGDTSVASWPSGGSAWRRKGGRADRIAWAAGEADLAKEVRNEAAGWYQTRAAARGSLEPRKYAAGSA